MVNRRDLIRLGALASAGLVGTAGAQETTTTQAAAEDVLFVAGLAGVNQVPAVDTDAIGLAVFAAGDDGVDYALAVANVENMLMAHIHIGGRGENGPVAVWLDPAVDAREPELREGTTTGITATGTITAEHLVGPLEGESLDALLQAMRESGAYVNVHTEQNQAGEIRGQTRSVDALIDMVL